MSPQYIEKIILLIIAIFQLHYFFKAKKYLNLFKRFSQAKLEFDFKRIKTEKADEEIPFVDNTRNETETREYLKIPQIHFLSKSPALERIENAINSYLEYNFGSVVNFSIIRDIFERELEAEREKIEQLIPVPLYLGLAATMLGIILGLISIPDLSSVNFSSGIGQLISSVKYAMSTSLLGLVLTTWLNIEYRPALEKVLLKKSEFISQLQAILLPELVKADETGYAGLKGALEKFSRDSVQIINSLHNAISKIESNLTKQNEIIDKVESLDISKLSKANVTLFEKIENSYNFLENLMRNLAAMEQITENLKEFSRRTEQMDQIAEVIKQNIFTSTKLMHFLSKHFEEIEKYGNKSLRAINLADHYFSEAINKLSELMQIKIKNIEKLTNEQEQLLNETYNFMINKLNEVTEQHVNKFTDAYKNAVPQFEELKHLLALQEIKADVQNIKENNIGLFEELQQNFPVILGFLEYTKSYLSKNDMERFFMELNNSLKKTNRSSSTKEKNEEKDNKIHHPIKNILRRLK